MQIYRDISPSEMSKNPAKVVQFKAEAAKTHISVLDERPWSDAGVPLELVSKEFDSFTQDLLTCQPEELDCNFAEDLIEHYFQVSCGTAYLTTCMKHHLLICHNP